MIRRTWWIIGAILVLLAGSIPFSMLLLNVRYDYTLQTVILGAGALGMLSGALGCFTVLRKQSLISDTLSHAALPGVAVAFLLAGRDLSVLLVGAGIAGWIGVLLIGSITKTTRIKQDSAMAIILSVSFAIGIALKNYIQKLGNASQAGLDSFIFGQAAAIVQQDVILVMAVSGVMFAILVLFWKEFKLVTFNPEFARTNGLPVRFLETILSTLIVVAIVLGLQLAGIILMVGLLIAPAVAARQWTRNLEQMVVLAGGFGAFSGMMGAILSAVDTGLPTGPLIVVVASILVGFSMAFAPERGLLWSWWKQRSDRRRFISQFVLDDMYSLVKRHYHG